MNHSVQIAFGVYMGMAVTSYIVLVLLSLRADRKYRQTFSYRNLLLWGLRKNQPSVTVLAPARNEEPIILPSVKALLGLGYPLVVVDDGSTDKTFDLLQTEYALQETSGATPETLPHKPILSVWHSAVEPRLTVVKKVWSGGSKGDGNNAGLEVVKTTYVFVTDIDSVVEPDAIIKMVARQQETKAIAIGCPLRPLNGCSTDRNGFRVQLPKNYWAFSQVIEYLRTFQLRQGWASMGMLNNISGAAGLFQTNALHEIGGYRTDTTAEDLASTFGFHQHKMPIAFEPSVNVYTQVPETWKSLASQRRRWARGLFDILVDSRKILTQGTRHTLLSLWLWAFEWIEPFIEVTGLCWIAERVYHHRMPFFWGWVILVGGMSITSLLSVICIVQQERLYRRLSTKAILMLIVFSWVEIFPFKIPLALMWRIYGTFAYLSGNKSWEPLPRQQFKEEKACDTLSQVAAVQSAAK